MFLWSVPGVVGWEPGTLRGLVVGQTCALCFRAVLTASPVTHHGFSPNDAGKLGHMGCFLHRTQWGV